MVGIVLFPRITAGETNPSTFDIFLHHVALGIALGISVRLSVNPCRTPPLQKDREHSVPRTSDAIL